jgi:hypothetical protein
MSCSVFSSLLYWKTVYHSFNRASKYQGSTQMLAISPAKSIRGAHFRQDES